MDTSRLRRTATLPSATGVGVRQLDSSERERERERERASEQPLHVQFPVPFRSWTTHTRLPLPLTRGPEVLRASLHPVPRRP